jgi:hypothetical protein
VPPSLGTAIRLSLLAFRRERWLSALGLLLAGARRALGWPALTVALALVLRGAASAARHDPGMLTAPLDGALAVLAAPRFMGLVGGLWLAGAAVAAALRVAWLSGALPVLGAAMAGAPRGTAGFAAGLAGGFFRVLAAAIVGFVLELSGALFAATIVLGAVLLAVQGGRGGALLPQAGLGALALTLAAAVPAALSIAADAVVARAAVRGEGPAAALAGATRRFLQRPGSFLLGGMLFGVALLAGRFAVSAFGGLAAGFGLDAPAVVRLGPELMLSVAAAFLAAVVELLWLGTVTALACGEVGLGVRLKA